jgi:outer membrane biosynthesis protein TonB
MKSRSRKKWILLIFGILLAALGVWVYFQYFHGKSPAPATAANTTTSASVMIGEKMNRKANGASLKTEDGGMPEPDELATAKPVQKPQVSKPKTAPERPREPREPREPKTAPKPPREPKPDSPPPSNLSPVARRRR